LHATYEGLLYSGFHGEPVFGPSQKVQMNYVADIKKQHLQGQSQLRSIAHIYKETKPQNRLNKGLCN
jgi:hypothetical protein